MSLYELFELGSKQKDLKQAICFYNGSETSTMSYSELTCVSHKICRELEIRQLRNNIISVVMSSGINVISSLLGIFKSNNCFYYLTPEDLKVPKRFESLKNRIKISCYLTDSEEVANELEKLTNCKSDVFYIGDVQMSMVRLEERHSLHSDVAYIVTTSGSTGSPKIVYVPNKSIVPNIYDVVESFEQTADDIVFLSSPLTFDPSYVQIFTTFLTGSCLLVVDDRIKLDSKKLLSSITSTHKVTILQTTPSLVSMFGDDSIKTTLLSASSSLRVLCLGGEKCPNISTLVKWKSEGNKTRIFNIYGITEVSSWATIHEILNSEFGIPNNEVCLGKTMSKTMLEVRNFNEETNEGELWIGGDERVCILDDEDVSIGPIVMRPSGDIVRKGEHGSLYYIGRTGGMIKRMGKRMHLQELEKVMMEMNDVVTSASLWAEESLVLFVVRCGTQFENNVGVDNEFTVRAMNHIKSWLPAHYLPNTILMLNQLPINNHGKVDKRMLLKLYSDYKSSLIESSKPSEVVCKFLELVSNSLGIPTLQQSYLDKSWTQLGGNSIMAVSVYSELQKSCPEIGNLLLDKILTGTSLQDIIDFISPKHSKLSSERKRKHSEDSMKENTKQRKIAYSDPLCCAVISRSANYFSQDSNHVGITKVRTVSGEDGSDHHFDLHECWKFDTGKCVDASPLIITSQEKGEVFIGSHSHKFFGLDLSTGVCNWKVELEDRIESSACISKCANFVITGCYSGNIYVLERSSGDIHWTFQTQNSVKCSPVTHPSTGVIYVGSHDGSIYALDIQNKNCQWSHNLESGSLFSSPCISPDGAKVFIGSLEGFIFCIDSISGKISWKVYLHKPIFSSPVIAGCLCLVGCVDGHLYAINIQNQQIVWSFKTNGPIFSSPTCYSSHSKELKREMIVFGSHDKHVYCIELATGSMIWKSGLDSEIYGIPGLLSKASPNLISSAQEVQAVLACSTKGTVYILNIDDGSVVSHLKTGAEIFSSPCCVGNKVLVGCRDNCLYCFEIK